jgi:ADP-ribosyl-[dinitrogen reductase] hydrolase
MNFKMDKAQGALVGLALGDALGTTLEFQLRPTSPVVTDIVGGGPFRLKAGQWTDDTSMMLCLADSLIKFGASNSQDQMQRYVAWRDEGYNSCTGSCFDIGATVSGALRRFEADGIALAGSDAPNSAGNGSLMRIAPVALMSHYGTLQSALEMAAEVSRTTHAEQRCIDACQYMTYLLHVLLNTEESMDKKELLTSVDPVFKSLMSDMHPETLKVITGSYFDKNRDQISSSGYVIDSLEAALWCFWNSETFERGAIMAANLGDDADTVAAIYGQLAGAFYGYNNLPRDWLNKLAWQEEICLRAYLLIARQNNLVIKRFIADCQTDISHNFLHSAYANGLMLAGWDWMSWIRQHQYLTEPRHIAGATIEECFCLITSINRGDRFTQGLLDGFADDGVLQAILKRLGELCADDAKRCYLFIGDIHGQVQKLDALLEQRGADDEECDDTFYVFIGDLIDNNVGDNINQLRTLERVKALVDAGRAECLMGNHELNAIGWALRHPTTPEPLRPHTEDNRKQHGAFLDEVGEDSALHQSWIAWFKRRPLFADFAEIRAIHACWDNDAIARLKPYLNPDYSLKAEYWLDAFDKQQELYHLLETLLKGPELDLPEGSSFKDKTGKERRQIRVRWWADKAENYRQLAQVPKGAESCVSDIPLPRAHTAHKLTAPVVVGHYTLSGYPAILSDNVVCVDYNAAKGDEPLVAYEWVSGESTALTDTDITFVGQQSLELFPLQGANALLQSHLQALRQSLEVNDDLFMLVDDFLWQKWDPIGVNIIQECRDEYEAYVEETALLAAAGNVEILSVWIWTLELELMGNSWDHYEHRAQAGRLALQLVDLVAQVNPSIPREK